MNTNNTHNNDRPLDPGLAHLADRLDALGRADGQAPSGLESRVLAAVAQELTPAPIPIGDRRGFWQRGSVRAAAGLALFASVGAVLYTASRPAMPAGPANQPEVLSVAMVEERLDAMLAFDDSDFGESIASIELWAEAIDSELDSGWLGTDAGDLGLYDEGAL